MGEPAVPDAVDRAHAHALADTLLAYVRDDEPMPPLDERQLWLLAATLRWYADRYKR